MDDVTGSFLLSCLGRSEDKKLHQAKNGFPCSEQAHGLVHSEEKDYSEPTLSDVRFGGSVTRVGREGKQVMAFILSIHFKKQYFMIFK